MNGRDAAGEIAIAHVRKTGRADLRRKRLLVRKLADAFHQIAVRLLRTASDTAEARDNLEGMKII